MYNLNDNDDDIFDDSSYLSSSDSSEVNSHFHSEEETNLSSFIDDIFGGQGKRFSVDKRKLVSTMVILFYKSVASWVNSEYDDHFRRAVITFNEHLLENKAKPFIYYEKYYSCMNSISKRRILSLFVLDLINDPQELTKTANNINFPLTESVIKTYFVSLYNINQFSILEEFAQYKSLAEYLDLPFSDQVMLETNDKGSVYGPIPYSHFTHTVFAKTVNQDYLSLFASSMKEAISRFVKVQDDEDKDEKNKE